MTLSSGPWWCAPVLALAWIWTVPAQIFCAPTRAKLIAAARFMPGVCGVLVSSWSPGMTLTPWVFQSTPPASCCSLMSLFPDRETVLSYGRAGRPSGARRLGDRHAAVDQPLDPLGHCRRGRDRVDPDLLRRIGDRQRAGDRGDAALGRGIAVAAGDA